MATSQKIFQNLHEFQPTGQALHAQFSSNKFKVHRIRLGGSPYSLKLCKLIFDQFVTDFEMFQQWDTCGQEQDLVFSKFLGGDLH